MGIMINDAQAGYLDPSQMPQQQMMVPQVIMPPEKNAWDAVMAGLDTFRSLPWQVQLVMGVLAGLVVLLVIRGRK